MRMCVCAEHLKAPYYIPWFCLFGLDFVRDREFQRALPAKLKDKLLRARARCYVKVVVRDCRAQQP